MENIKSDIIRLVQSINDPSTLKLILEVVVHVM